MTARQAALIARIRKEAHNTLQDLLLQHDDVSLQVQKRILDEVDCIMHRILEEDFRRHE